MKQKTKAEHTPGPKWYFTKSGGHDIHGQGLVIDEKTGDNIAVVYKSENSEVIVQAVNNYEKLLSDKTDLLAALVSVINKQDIPSMFQLPNNCPEIIQARTAIAKAEGE